MFPYTESRNCFIIFLPMFYRLSPLWGKLGTSIHVFDHTIKPILLYGREIWGSFNTQTAKFKNDRQITLDHIFNNLMCEKLRIKFGKFILGVHRKTTNQAVLSQIGRFPIYFGIIKSMLNYWQRLEYLDSLQKVFQINPGFLDIKYKKKWSKEYVVKSLRKHFFGSVERKEE